MAAHKSLRVRESLTVLQDKYKSGDKAPLENLMRAWKAIKALPPQDPNSFFMIGGYHGEPFRGAGWGNASYWGGYCNHGNVLFPTWHRAYLMRVENALRSVKGCKDVTIPFWDETSPDSVANGIPWALTDEKFVLDGKTIDNPLRSFTFTANIKDHIGGDNPDYSKPLGYETVRYPLSGLVGPADIKATKAHNAKFPNYTKNVDLLNQNIINWLGSNIVVNGKPMQTNVYKKYTECLDAPNYTVFSNTTSAAQWNDNLPSGTSPVVPLEAPHNSIHLAVGGYDVPAGPNTGSYSPIPGANGDMGENDTAGLDPIFFFHHCFVDRVFWLWQQKQGYTHKLDVIEGYPGTNSVDSQGPTPGVYANSWLTLDSPLDPFDMPDGRRRMTSRDCINIEGDLGYTYGPGSLMPLPALKMAGPPSGPARVVQVGGINRAKIRGSFLISAYATIGKTKHHLGTEAVLSRWHVDGCANCQTHLEAGAMIDIHELSEDLVHDGNVDVEVLTRDGPLRPRRMVGVAGEIEGQQPFKFQIRKFD